MVTVTLQAGAVGRVAGSLAVASPAQVNPQATVYRVSVANQRGEPVTSFAAPVTMAVKYAPADLAGANGDPKLLSMAYLVDATTPTMANPDAFPPGSWLLFPSSASSIDATHGVITVQAQTLGSAIGVFSNATPEVETIAPSTPLLSSFDAPTSRVFGARPEGTRLRAVEPQIGDRLFVIEPDTGNYAYVDAANVAPVSENHPSAAPPAGQ